MIQGSCSQRKNRALFYRFGQNIFNHSSGHSRIPNFVAHSSSSPFNAFPLSFAQQRLWFLEQWAAGSPAYTLPAALRLTGPLHVPRPLTEALTALGRCEGATLFMILLAAFKVLLYRYCGQEDIVVGTPIAGRTRAETEPLIGCFVNTLVLRTDLAGDPTFRELLGRLRGVSLEAYAHQDLPFEQLVEALAPGREAGHPPLFQVMFGLKDAPLPEVELAELTLEPLEVENGTAKYDLTLDLTETSAGARGWLEYSTDLFDAATIARMAGHFATLLEGIVADADCRVSALPLLAAAERRQALIEWNATAAEYPRDRCIHDLFADQARRTPEHLAVIFEDRRLTYAELNRRANQLARYLRRLQVGPEARVGICMERSADLIVALLAILEAGAAYVPLDPTYPDERIQYMLEDAQVSVLLTQKSIYDLRFTIWTNRKRQS